MPALTAQIPGSCGTLGSCTAGPEGTTVAGIFTVVGSRARTGMGISRIALGAEPRLIGANILAQAGPVAAGAVVDLAAAPRALRGVLFKLTPGGAIFALGRRLAGLLPGCFLLYFAVNTRLKFWDYADLCLGRM